MQIKSNSSHIEDSGSSQALESNNKSAEGSSRKTILKALQGSARSDALSKGKNAWLSSSQKATKNLGTISSKDPIEVSASSSNEKFGREYEITAKIG